MEAFLNVGLQFGNAWRGGLQFGNIPKRQQTFSLELEVKASLGLQVGLDLILGENIGGILSGPAVEGTGTFSIDYLVDDNRFEFNYNGETVNIDYHIGASLYNLMGLDKVRKYGIYNGDQLSKTTERTNLAYLVETKQVNGVYDPASESIKVGFGVDVRLGVGVGIEGRFRVGYR